MIYKFHPLARREFDDAIDYYEVRQRGLGKRYQEIIEHSVKRIAKVPQTFPLIENGVRRFVTSVFPYSILFTIEQDYILIVAVMHQSRKPDYWRLRYE